MKYIIQIKNEGKWRNYAIYNTPITVSEFCQESGVNFKKIRIIKKEINC